MRPSVLLACWQMERLYAGVGTEQTKEVVDFWKKAWGGVGGIDCVEGPEEEMIQGLLNRALLTVYLPKGGQTFECTIFADAERQPASGDSSSTGSSGKAGMLCSFLGTREELVDVCLGLAALEGSNEYDTSGWFPRNSRIAFQRQGASGRDARYRLRVSAVHGLLNWTALDSGRVQGVVWRKGARKEMHARWEVAGR